MTDRIYNLFIAYRLKELLPKTGFALVGSLIAIEHFTVMRLELLFQVFIISFFTGLAVYCINSWADYETDQANPRLVETHRLSREEFLKTIFLAGIVAVSLTIVWLPSIIAVVLATLLLWALYSIKPFRLKNVPFGGLVLSFVTQIIQFHIGYLAFASFGYESMYYSVFFAFLVAGGHIIHECIDLEADQKTETRTTTVYLGLPTALKLSLALFFLSFFWAVLGLQLKIMSTTFSVIVILAFLVISLTHPTLKIWKHSNLFSYRRFYLITFSSALFLYAILSKF